MQPERVALLLAAGFSRRYGSDKRLAGSPPLILRTLATLLPCHDSVLVVLRQRDEAMRRLLADSGAELTQVPRDGGLGDSLATGCVPCWEAAAPSTACSSPWPTCPASPPPACGRCKPPRLAGR
ncbi:NTP transferase domain-containing protein [Aeromonas sp. 3925]|nr:NTP transferase domain-containing protein [Aeromonas genomosp. paramedia]